MIIRFFIVSTLLSTSALAQNNLSGTWRLQNKEPIAGPQYANSLPKQLSIHQQGDSLILESINVGADGNDARSRLAVAMDGKPATLNNTALNRKLVKSLQWNTDKQGLVLTTVYYLPGNPNEVDFTRVETWRLAPDGQQLTIDKRSVETRSETWQIKGTYNKQ